MKKNNLLIFLILLSVYVNAQRQDTVKSFGISVDYSNSGCYIGDAINPNLSIDFKRHFASIGILIIPVGASSPQKKILTGLQLTYRFYPNYKDRLFSFFFDYNLHFLKAKNNNYYYNLSMGLPPVTVDQTMAYKVMDFCDVSGLGVDLNFIRNICLTTSFGLGVDWHKEEITNTFTNGYSYTTGDYKTQFDYSSIIKLGLRYYFKIDK